jgi:hypothetical protein
MDSYAQELKEAKKIIKKQEPWKAVPILNKLVTDSTSTVKGEAYFQLAIAKSRITKDYSPCNDFGKAKMLGYLIEAEVLKQYNCN